MKHYRFISAFLLCFGLINCLAQREADLKIEFTHPQPYTEVTSPGKLLYKFKIINQGPDSLLPNDTIVFRPSHQFSGGSEELRVRGLGMIVPPNDSMIMEDSVIMNGTVDVDSFVLQFSYLPACFGKQPNNPLQSETYEQKIKDNNPKLTLRHKYASINAILPNPRIGAYPNPVVEKNFFVRLPLGFQNSKMNIYNLNGQELSFNQEFIRSDLAHITFDNFLEQGMYYLTINHNKIGSKVIRILVL